MNTVLDPAELPLLLTTTELAELIRVGPSTIAWQRVHGRKPGSIAIRAGKRYLYPRDQVLAWLDDELRRERQRRSAGSR